MTTTYIHIYDDAEIEDLDGTIRINNIYLTMTNKVKKNLRKILEEKDTMREILIKMKEECLIKKCHSCEYREECKEIWDDLEHIPYEMNIEQELKNLKERDKC